MTAAVKNRFGRGLTIIEVVVAVLILAVALTGALSYQYHAVRRAGMARSQITATRLAQLVIEDWKSTGGDANYDPTALKLGFETQSDNKYQITVDRIPMVLSLSYSDIDVDSTAGTTLRRIDAAIRWRPDIAPDVTEEPSFTMTTYVRRDAGSG